MAESPAAARKLILGLFAALAAWGIYLAVGDYLAHGNPWRSALTIACMSAFLLLWFITLRIRQLRNDE